MAESILGNNKVLNYKSSGTACNCSAYIVPNANHSSVFNIGTGNFTFSVWYRTNNAGTILCFTQGSSQQTPYLSINQSINGDITLDVVGAGSWNIGQQTNLSNGQWHQLVIVRNGTTLTFYVDGLKQVVHTKGNVGFNMSNITGIVLSAQGKTSNDTVLDADFADIRLWSKVINNTDIQDKRFIRLSASELTDTHLLGYWDFQSGSVTDLSTYASTGTLSNGVISTKNVHHDITDYALLVDQENNAVSIAGNSVYSFRTSAFTLECWVNTRSGGGVLTCMDENTENGYRLSIDNNGCIVLEIKTSDSHKSFSTNGTRILGDNRWHHIAAVRESHADYGVIHIYLDGVEMDLQTGSESYFYGSIEVSNTTPLILGAKSKKDMGPAVGHLIPSDIRGLHLLLGEVCMWNTARSASDIYDAMLRRLHASEHADLIGYWTFSTRNIVDVSQTKNLSVLPYESSIEISSLPMRGREFALTNTDNTGYVSCSNTATSSYSLGNGDFTFSSWVKAGNSFAGGCIFSQSASGISTSAVEVLLSSAGAITLNLSAPSTGDEERIVVNHYPFNTVSDLVSGQWHHIAVVRDSEHITLFVDGILLQHIAIQKPVINIPSASTIYIGSNVFTSNNFIGMLSEVRVWNTAQSQKDIQQYMWHSLPAQDLDSLVGYWSFDQRAPIDLSAKSNDGTMHGSSDIVAATGLALNPPQSTLYFNDNTGATQTQISKTDLLSVASAFTVQMWFKIDENNQTQTLFANANYNSGTSSVDSAFYLGINTDNKVIFGKEAITPLATSIITLRRHQWYEATVTYDGTTTKLYVNGNEEASTTSFTYTALTSNNVCILGSYPGASNVTNSLTGAIHSLTIWNSAKKNSFIMDNLFTWYSGSETGLLCYQNFHDAELKDMTGNGYDVVMGVGSSEFRVTDFSDRKIHFALCLDQTSPGQYLDNANASNLQITDNAITLQAAIRINDLANDSNVIAAMGSGYSLAINKSGSAIFTINTPSPSSITGATALNDGEWHFITAIYNFTANQLLLYVDGSQDTSPVTVSGAITYGSNTHFSIGAQQSTASSSYFSGYIKNVRVWNTVLSGDTISMGESRQLIGNEDNLQAYWPLNNTYNHSSSSSGVTDTITTTELSRDFSNNQYAVTFNHSTDLSSSAFLSPSDLPLLMAQPYIKAQSRLMEDWIENDNGTVDNISIFRTVITVLRGDGTPVPSTKMRIWAVDPKDISGSTQPIGGGADTDTSVTVNPLTVTIGGAPYVIDESRSASIVSDSIGNVIISSVATDLSTFSLKIWADFMEEDERIIISPDDNLHTNLKNITGPDLQANRIPNSSGGYEQPALLPSTGTHSIDAEGAQAVADALNNAVDTISSPLGEQITPSKYTYLGATTTERTAGTFLHPDVQSQQWTSTHNDPIFDRTVEFQSSWTLTLGDNEPSESSGGSGISFALHSDEESAHIIDKLGLHNPIYLTDDLMGIGSWFHSFVNGAEHIGSVAFHKIIKGGKELVHLVVQTSEKIHDFILTQVKHIGQSMLGFLNSVLVKYLHFDAEALVGKVLNFFRNMFNWPDIVDTAEVLSNLMIQVPVLMNKAIDGANDLVDSAIDALKLKIEGYLDSAITAIGNDTPSSIMGSYAPSPSGAGMLDTSPSMMVAMHSHENEKTWMLHKFLDSHNPNDSSGQDKSQDFLSKASKDLEALGKKLEKNMTDPDILATFHEILGYLKQILANPHNLIQLGIKALLSVLKLIAVVALDLIKSIVDIAFAALKLVFDAVGSALSQHISIPIITWLFEHKIMPGHQLTAANLAAIITAIPCTIIYKAIRGSDNLPFKNLSYLKKYSIPENIFWPWSTGTKPSGYVSYKYLFQQVPPHLGEEVEAVSASLQKDLAIAYAILYPIAAIGETVSDSFTVADKELPGQISAVLVAINLGGNSIVCPGFALSDNTLVNVFDFIIWLLKYIGPGIDSYVIGKEVKKRRVEQDALDPNAEPILVLEGGGADNTTITQEMAKIVGDLKGITKAKYCIVTGTGLALFFLSFASFIAELSHVEKDKKKSVAIKLLGNMGESFLPAGKFGFLFESIPELRLLPVLFDVVGGLFASGAAIARAVELPSS